MSRRYVKELETGESVDEIYLVADKHLRTTRQGGLYLQVELRDRTGTLDARLWNATEQHAATFEAGQYVRARGRTQLHQGALQLVLAGLDAIPSPDVDPDEFLPAPACDIGKLLERLRQLGRSVKEPHLRAIVETLLVDDAFLERFTRAPAGVRHHHAYPGGLLEHVVTMLELGDRIAPLYPEVDRDLLLVGIFLHDIGKIHELSYDSSLSYTDEGQLIGHLVQGVCLLREKIRVAEDLLGNPVPEELRLRLEHMIVSHHGSHEFGSPKLPMTPEAVALAGIDRLDSQLHHLTSQLRDEAARGTRWTAYDPNQGRKYFKGSRPSVEANGSS
jgi:3'-5' exoribonuclease